MKKYCEECGKEIDVTVKRGVRKPKFCEACKKKRQQKLKHNIYLKNKKLEQDHRNINCLFSQ